MLLINDIRADKKGIITRLAKRGVDFTTLVNSALSLDDKRKSTQVELDNTLAEANKISKEIGQLFAQKKITRLVNFPLKKNHKVILAF